MLQTYKSHLSNRQQLSDDTVLFTFILDEPKEIVFTAGQYLILLVPDKASTTAPVVRRLYSIASSPTEKNSFELLVHIISDGVAGKYFNQLRIGDTGTFEGPAGQFVLHESSRDKIFLATGCGIAPIRSMLMSKLKSQNSNPNLKTEKLCLFWGQPYFNETYLFNELKKLTTDFPNFQFKICLSREQNLDMVPEADKKYFLLGRVTNGFEQIILHTPYSILNSDFYLCSGREVVESLKEYVYQKGTPKEQVYFEKF